MVVSCFVNPVMEIYFLSDTQDLVRIVRNYLMDPRPGGAFWTCTVFSKEASTYSTALRLKWRFFRLSRTLGLTSSSLTIAWWTSSNQEMSNSPVRLHSPNPLPEAIELMSCRRKAIAWPYNFTQFAGPCRSWLDITSITSFLSGTKTFINLWSWR